VGDLTTGAPPALDNNSKRPYGSPLRIEEEKEPRMSIRFERVPKIEKLVLNKETIQHLSESEAEQARGGWIRPPISWSCPQPSQSGCCPRTEG